MPRTKGHPEPHPFGTFYKLCSGKVTSDIGVWRAQATLPQPPYTHTSHQASINVHRTQQCQRGLERLVNGKRRGKPKHTNDHVHLPPETICYLYLSPVHTQGSEDTAQLHSHHCLYGLGPCLLYWGFLLFYLNIWTFVKDCGYLRKLVKVGQNHTHREEGVECPTRTYSKLKKASPGFWMCAVPKSGLRLIAQEIQSADNRGVNLFLATIRKRHAWRVPTTCMLWHGINHVMGESKGRLFCHKVLWSIANQK